MKSGIEMTENGNDFRSPSNLSASKTWYTKIGITVKEFPIAEFIAVRRWACDTSGVRNKIPQNITLYNTPIWIIEIQFINGFCLKDALNICLFFVSFAMCSRLNYVYVLYL